MANWDYILLKPAQRYFKRMPTEDQLRITEALDQLVEDSTELDIIFCFLSS